MKHFDFVIIIETKQRELDGYCLLKAELERRGYSVYITSQEDIKWISKPVYDATVVIVNVVGPNVWNDGNLHRFVEFKKVIEMRFEQIRMEHDYCDEFVEEYWRAESIAKDCVSITWGADSSTFARDILGYRKEQIKEIGYIATDFFRPEFEEYYTSRRNLSNTYKIDESRQWCLFISSFLGLKPELDPNADEFSRESAILLWNSQQIIIDWMENAAKRFKDKEFIYRPHPYEYICDKLKRIDEENCNFHIIKEDSIRQWIHNSDTIYTFYSTSAFEIYLSKKSFHVLRPFEVKPEYDEPMYIGGKFVESYVDYEKTLMCSETNKEFPINMDYVSRVYKMDEGFVFRRLADVCEEVAYDDIYNVKPENMKEFREFQALRFSKTILADKLRGNRVYFVLFKWIVLNTQLFGKERTERWKMQWRWSVSQKEIEERQIIFTKIVNKIAENKK